MPPPKSVAHEKRKRKSVGQPASKLSIEAIVLGAYRKVARDNVIRQAMKECFSGYGRAQ